MNSKNNESEQDSLIFISQRLEIVLEQMKIITEEIAEMKAREGSKYGDH